MMDNFIFKDYQNLDTLKYKHKILQWKYEYHYKNHFNYQPTNALT